MEIILKALQDAGTVIKNLDFELSESQFGVEIWQNTNAMSQARIKELERRETKLAEALQEALCIASDDNGEYFGGSLNKRQIAIVSWKKQAKFLLGMTNKGNV